MKRRILSLLIALLVSVMITVVLFFAAGFAGGACHCMTPVSVLFPYGTFIGMRTSWENTGLLATVLQFPLYAITIGIVAGRRWKLLASLLILVVHSVAAIGAVNMYRWW
jgi:hypothetical protein